MNQPNNKRHQDTAKRIQDAMLTLLEEKDFSHITVQDVCKISGINRSTFYRHYLDIPDLMEKLEKSIQSGIIEQWGNAAKDNTSEFISQAAICRLLSYIQEHKNFYLAYLRDYPNRGHREELNNVFDSYLLPLFENYGIVDRGHMLYYYRYTAAGCRAVISCWLEEGTPETPEEIAGILYAMLKAPQ